MKILSIGNSFSEDAHTYLGKIARSAGVEVKAVNLYIGGCSLALHWDNICSGEQAYEYMLEGNRTGRMASIPEVLAEESWDAVTLQQASHDSGLYETYAPGNSLAAYVREHCPGAKIWFHKTWSYQTDSTHPGFAHYGNSQAKMDRCITAAADRFCRENGDLPQLPVGDVIRELRKKAPFDYENGGQSLYRDGFHMGVIYGRYAAAATWFQTLFGGLERADFVPAYKDLTGGYETLLPEDFETDIRLIHAIRETVCNLR